MLSILNTPVAFSYRNGNKIGDCFARPESIIVGSESIIVGSESIIVGSKSIIVRSRSIIVGSGSVVVRFIVVGSLAIALDLDPLLYPDPLSLLDPDPLDHYLLLLNVFNGSGSVDIGLGPVVFY